jgi:hypothetical protein
MSRSQPPLGVLPRVLAATLRAVRSARPVGLGPAPRRGGIIVLALALAACVDKSAGQQQKQIDPAYIAANLLTAPPATLTNVVNADLGGKVTYLGNVVDMTPLVPGQKVVIKHYWKVVAPPGDEWRVFSHLRGQGPHPDFVNVDATDMRTGHPPADWKAGEIIQDEQSFTVPSTWSATTATLIVGLYPKGKHQVSDRMPVKSGPSLDQAVVAVKFQVDTAKGPPAAGTIKVRKAIGAITIDGRDTDTAWKGAVASGEFPTAEGLPDPSGKTVARMTWDDRALYLFVSADDTDVASQYKNQDDPLWKEDAIEIFIDADSNRHGYVELQVNPNNAHFDTWWPTTRAQPDDKSYDSKMETAVQVHGTLDNRDDTDQGWDVEIAIPWDAVKGKDPNMNVRLPPQPGDSWRMNVVRVDKGKGAEIAASSWNRITRDDFHALDRMLTVVFADASGNTTPPPVTPPIGPPPVSPQPPNNPGVGPVVPTSPPGRESGPNGAAGSGSGSATGSGSNAIQPHVIRETMRPPNVAPAKPPATQP